MKDVAVLVFKVALCMVGGIGFLFWPVLIIGGIFRLKEAADYVEIIWILLLIAGMWYSENRDTKG